MNVYSAQPVGKIREQIVFLRCSPGWLADESIPDVVGEDALGLVLQRLHTPRLAQARRLRLEQDDGLHAAALCRVWRHVAEPDTTLSIILSWILI